MYFLAVSMTEILDELPKLSVEERHLLFQRLNELETGEMEETPEMLAAIDEARAEPSTTDVSAEELSRDVVRWARTK
jgi:hypothetical protein